MFKELISMPFYFATAKAQRKLAEKIKPVRVDYQESPYAKEMYGAAKLGMNGRMAGAAQAEANIQQSQANTLGATQRGATSAAQFLALASAAQQGTNNAYGNLGVAEAQDQQRRLGNLMNAQNTMIGEGDKVYNDKMQKYLEESQTKAALLSSSMQNKFNGVSAIGGFFDSTADAAMKLIGMGGTGGGQQQQGGQVSTGFNPFQQQAPMSSQDIFYQKRQQTLGY